MGRLDWDRGVRFAVGLVLAAGFFAVVALPSRGLAGFYAQLDALSDSVRRGDFVRTETDLAAITAFYERSRALGLDWIADSYLFRDAFLQQAAYDYLAGDYEAVVDALADDVDNPRASFLLGNAKFQLARRRYRAIPDDDPDAVQRRQAIVQEVLDDVNGDYERAVRIDSEGRFDLAWNYDLTSDPEATRRALEPLREIEPPELEQMRGEGTPVRRRRG